MAEDAPATTNPTSGPPANAGAAAPGADAQQPSTGVALAAFFDNDDALDNVPSDALAMAESQVYGKGFTARDLIASIGPEVKVTMADPFKPVPLDPILAEPAQQPAQQPVAPVGQQAPAQAPQAQPAFAPQQPATATPAAPLSKGALYDAMVNLGVDPAAALAAAFGQTAAAPANPAAPVEPAAPVVPPAMAALQTIDAEITALRGKRGEVMYNDEASTALQDQIDSLVLKRQDALLDARQEKQQIEQHTVQQQQQTVQARVDAEWFGLLNANPSLKDAESPLSKACEAADATYRSNPAFAAFVDTPGYRQFIVSNVAAVMGAVPAAAATIPPPVAQPRPGFAPPPVASYQPALGGQQGAPQGQQPINYNDPDVLENLPDAVLNDIEARMYANSRLITRRG